MLRIFAAELIGTFVLVFAGCGSAVLAGDHIGYAGVAASFGLALLTMVYTVGPISGCHLNPAVTLALTLSRKLKPALAPGYMVAQVAGGVLAAAALLVVAKGTGHYDPVAAGFASNGFGDRSPGHYGMASAFLIEALMTALLVLVILGSTDIAAPVGFAGVAIGLALTLIHLVSIPVTNTSVNPARSFGPALFAGPGALSQLWLFVVAPLAGGALGVVVYGLLRAAKPEGQISARQAAAALPAEQAQRIDRATPPG